MTERCLFFALAVGMLLFPGCAVSQTSDQKVTWDFLPDMPTPRTEVAGAAVGHNIYAIGGFAHNGKAVATVEIFDSIDQEWTAGPDLPLAVHHAMAASWHDSVYVVGGYQSGSFDQISNRVFVLSGNEWSELPPMPEGRSAGGAAVASESLFVVGGVNDHGLGTSTLVFDLARQSWSKLSGLPTPREHLGVAASGDYVYALGGRVGSPSGNLNSAERLNTSSGSWAAIDPMPSAAGGLASVETDNGIVVAAGGEDATRSLSKVHGWIVDEDRWIEFPDLRVARHGVAVVTVGTAVYVIAGGPTPGLDYSGTVEAIDTAKLLRMMTK